MFWSQFLEKEKVLNKIWRYVRGDLVYGNYIVWRMVYSDKALSTIIKSLTNKKASVSLKHAPKWKIDITITALRWDFLTENIMDALIASKNIYSKYMT